MSTLIAPCTPLIECGADCCLPGAFQSIEILPRVTGGLMVNYQLQSAAVYGGMRGSLFDANGACLSDGDAAAQLTLPVTVRLEFSRAGTPTAGDWTAIGNWQADTGMLTDPLQRDAGWYNRTSYRLAVKGANDVVAYSPAFTAEVAGLSRAEQRMLRKIITDENRRYMSKNTPARIGYLLKVRYYGSRCSECFDEETGKTFKHDCNTCHGVGFELGYYPPHPCFFAEFTPQSHDFSIDDELGNLVKESPTGLRYVNIPAVHPWDVWVDAATDYRYIVGQVQPLASFGPYNVICQAVAGRLSFDHPAYKIEVSG